MSINSQPENTPLLHHHHHHHDHDHDHDHEQHNDLTKLRYACVLTTLFFVIELIGGYVASSLAIMSDAAHLLSDLAGFIISLIALSVATLPASPRLSFGFARAEVLGAFVSIFLIWSLTAVLVFFAILRLFNPSPVNGPLMALLGIIGLIVNIILMLVLGHNHSHHTHEHEHDEENACSLHHHSSEVHIHTDTNTNTNDLWQRFIRLLFGSDIQSVNVRAAYLHTIGDLLQSIGVIIASIIICINPKLSFVDPICTLIFACLVIFTTSSLAKDTITVLMEGTPPSVKLIDLHKKLIEVDGVYAITDLHVWSLSPSNPALSVHLLKNDDISSHKLLKNVQKMLSSKFHIVHATIQINCLQHSCCKENTYLGNPTNKKPKCCLTFT